MREFPLVITKPFSQGLRPEKEITLPNEFLAECYNMKPSVSGLQKYDEAVDPFSGAVNTNWPWPQLFLTEEYRLLGEETSVSSVGSGTFPWSINALTTLDPANPTTTATIPSGGGPWEFESFGESWFLSKENATVFKLGFDRITGDAKRFFVDTSVSLNALAQHRGRMVIGGFDSSNFWPNSWTGIFTSWQGDADAGTTYQFDDLDQNWIAWSSIGEIDFPAWLFFPTDIAFDVGVDEHNLLQRVRRNELGWMRMPFQGKVLQIEPLGQGLIVYGEDGVAVLQLTGVSNIDGIGDPAASTYGIVRSFPIGLSSRQSVAVGPSQHVFISNSGELCVLDGEFQLQVLGYQEYLGNMAEQQILGFYEPYAEEYHFCTELESFALTSQGLYEHKDHYTAYLGEFGTTYGLSHSPSTSGIELKTVPIDMRVQARKRLNNVHISARNVEDLQAKLNTRFGFNQPWESTGLLDTNLEGIVHKHINGLEFEVELYGSAVTGATIDQLTLRYQLPDKRAIRGAFPDVS